MYNITISWRLWITCTWNKTVDIKCCAHDAFLK